MYFYLCPRAKGFYDSFRNIIYILYDFQYNARAYEMFVEFEKGGETLSSIHIPEELRISVLPLWIVMKWSF